MTFLDFFAFSYYIRISIVYVGKEARMNVAARNRHVSTIY